tara:strand:+ start:874 stop:1056 length:183 start_codon:yes stop_codon:yes gene_type:complete
VQELAMPDQGCRSEDGDMSDGDMFRESLDTTETGNNGLFQDLHVAADMASDTIPIVVVRE